MDHWFAHPSLRTVVIAVLSWVTVFVLLTLTGVLFQNSSLLPLLAMAAILGIVVRLAMNYTHNKRGG